MGVKPTMPGSCKRENTGLNAEYKETVLRCTLMMQANQSTVSHLGEQKSKRQHQKKKIPRSKHTLKQCMCFQTYFCRTALP